MLEYINEPKKDAISAAKLVKILVIRISRLVAQIKYERIKYRVKCPYIPFDIG